MQIVVGEVSSGAIIAFPKDGVVLQSLKETFPKARWDQGRRAWHVPGVRAYKRSLAWVEDISGVVANREAAALVALAVARETAPKSKYVWYHERGATVVTPYSNRIVEIYRSLEGRLIVARRHGKSLQPDQPIWSRSSVKSTGSRRRSISGRPRGKQQSRRAI